MSTEELSVGMSVFVLQQTKLLCRRPRLSLSVKDNSEKVNCMFGLLECDIPPSFSPWNMEVYVKSWSRFSFMEANFNSIRRVVVKTSSTKISLKPIQPISFLFMNRHKGAIFLCLCGRCLVWDKLFKTSVSLCWLPAHPVYMHTCSYACSAHRLWTQGLLISVDR